MGLGGLGGLERDNGGVLFVIFHVSKDRCNGPEDL